jgi:hypothetical protein
MSIRGVGSALGTLALGVVSSAIWDGIKSDAAVVHIVALAGIWAIILTAFSKLHAGLLVPPLRSARAGSCRAHLAWVIYSFNVCLSCAVVFATNAVLVLVAPGNPRAFTAVDSGLIIAMLAIASAWVLVLALRVAAGRRPLLRIASRRHRHVPA